MPNTRKRKIDFKRLADGNFSGTDRTATETVERREVLPETYDVERIIACRKLKRCEEYFLKWVGFSSYECTWEPADHLPAYLIQEFREPTQPLPPIQLQDVSDNILTAFQDRLHRRTGSHFYIEIKHNIFRNILKAKPDNLYMKSVFDNLLFPHGWHVVFYSNQMEGMRIKFPVYVKPILRWSKNSLKFTEMVL
ncbi:CBX3 [Mytilus coruscus]|uniref:CBX3 n=1 Tax=Mytilus coruscus TaxID=42192 RepID=A0A6J8B7U1_MYTCO|nr:CBX3 [Mytilus coruscus]